MEVRPSAYGKGKKRSFLVRPHSCRGSSAKRKKGRPKRRVTAGRGGKRVNLMSSHRHFSRRGFITKGGTILLWEN